jgi:hypothetical protein
MIEGISSSDISARINILGEFIENPNITDERRLSTYIGKKMLGIIADSIKQRSEESLEERHPALYDKNLHTLLEYYLDLQPRMDIDVSINILEKIQGL